MQGALEGIRVIDLSAYLSGPYCAMLLADLGADVIKVERAGSGDDTRNVPPFIGGESAPFLLWNRNKRGVQLDLKDEAGREGLRELVKSADILVENFRPGTMERLGLGYEALRAINPRLIYGSISGFGTNGPYRDRGGFDLMAQAMSGLMSICGPKDGPPHRLPIAVSDVAAGMYLTIALLAALESRHTTGTGQRVETSLLTSAISLCLYEAAGFFATGERPERLGQGHRGNAPYQVFQTADGWLTVGAAQPEFWRRLCGILEAEELIEDPRFVTNALRVQNNDALVVLLEQHFRTRPSTDWMTMLDAAGIPCGPVLSHDQVFTDPHVLAEGMVVEVDHPVSGRMKTLGSPMKLSQTPVQFRRPAPRKGGRVEDVLAALPSET